MKTYKKQLQNKFDNRFSNSISLLKFLLTTSTVIFLIAISLYSCTTTMNNILVKTGLRKEDPARVKEIKDKWNSYKPQATIGIDSIYLITPSFTSPYIAGKLSQVYLDDALHYINYARFVAQLDPLVLDEVRNDIAQHQIVLAASVGSLSKVITKPTNMDDAFYANSTKYLQSSYLLSNQEFIYPPYTLFKDFLFDSDTIDIKELPHRRTLLNPQLTTIGIGYVKQDKTNYISLIYENLKKSGDQMASSSDGTPTVEYRAWPTEGYFPSNLWHEEQAWSITLNSNVYDNTKIKDIKIDLTQIGGKSNWTFNVTHKDTKSRFMAIDTANYGDTFTIIFKPESLKLDYIVKKNTRYQVIISGLYNKNGSPTSITYTVEFFQIF